MDVRFKVTSSELGRTVACVFNHEKLVRITASWNTAGVIGWIKLFYGTVLDGAILIHGDIKAEDCNNFFGTDLRLLLCFTPKFS